MRELSRQLDPLPAAGASQSPQVAQPTLLQQSMPVMGPPASIPQNHLSPTSGTPSSFKTQPKYRPPVVGQPVAPAASQQPRVDQASQTGSSEKQTRAEMADAYLAEADALVQTLELQVAQKQMQIENLIASQQAANQTKPEQIDQGEQDTSSSVVPSTRESIEEPGTSSDSDSRCTKDAAPSPARSKRGSTSSISESEFEPRKILSVGQGPQVEPITPSGLEELQRLGGIDNNDLAKDKKILYLEQKIEWLTRILAVTQADDLQPNHAGKLRALRELSQTLVPKGNQARLDVKFYLDRLIRAMQDPDCNVPYETNVIIIELDNSKKEKSTLLAEIGSPNQRLKLLTAIATEELIDGEPSPPMELPEPYRGLRLPPKWRASGVIPSPDPATVVPARTVENYQEVSQQGLKGAIDRTPLANQGRKVAIGITYVRR